MIINSHEKVVEIWLNSKEGLYNYALKHTKDKDIAADITQQVLMKIYRACFKNTEVKNTRSWLFQIAHHAIIDYHKRQQKNNFVNIDFSKSDHPSVWSDLAVYMEPLINFLPDKYATPLKMYVLDGLKQTEIANQLNLSLSATKSRILRAKNLLRQEIEACCHLEKRADGQILDFRVKESCKPLQKFMQQQFNNSNCC